MSAGPYDQEQIDATIRETFENCVVNNNSLLVSEYAAAVDQYKKMKAAGHPTAIPVPEPSYRFIDYADRSWILKQDGPPVCPQYVEAGEAPVALVVAIGPAIEGMPGRYLRGYLNGVPDNTPAGYLVQPFGAGGPTFKKVIDPSPFGFTAYYVFVQ